MEACKRWEIRAGLHNHLGTAVETQEQLLHFLKECPDCGLLLDVGHLAAAEGGDPLYILEHYADRLVAIHLKDYAGRDTTKDERIRFHRFSERKEQYNHT